ncbi:hypothetical protein GCK72_009307 [Caenorhabditis remanei]|uniref:E3 ubiquitin-protein ligase n=1 Tax=Caenorhabditis remanei TaxID=31234 RepID=A0A6A5H3E5_CAERE|nr:hypothetical protein GCK72_009307 [Caenorhabditis remanei]KAF1761053.1 hypothetical protein GCK72_009307 [Caenorhabditis remanei]
MNAVIEAECPVCSSQMIAPTAIPACGHKFCFTCLKGVCMNGMGCPMCRGPIDPSIFSLPSQVLDLKMDVPLSPVVVQDKYKPIEKRDTSPSETPAPSALNLDASLLDDNLPEEKMYWLYRGKNQGWWRFDPRHERDIDKAYNNDEDHCEVTICGRTYVIDFNGQCQYPKGVPTQRREVKRVSSADFDTMGVKGLAGVFVPTS